MKLTEKVLFQYGKSVSLSCNIPLPIKFYVNNVEATSSKYEINSTFLTIKTISKQNDIFNEIILNCLLEKTDILNRYFCNNTAGDRIDFEKGISPHLYKVDFMTVFGVSGTEAKLSCYLLVGSENNQTVNWYWKNSNGLTLNTENQYKIENKNDSSTLILIKGDLKDSGNYECLATNLYGSHNRSTKLVIKSNLAPIWPFLGAIGELVLLAIILFYYELFVKKEFKLFKRQKTAPLSLTDTRSMDSKSSSSETELINVKSIF